MFLQYVYCAIVMCAKSVLRFLLLSACIWQFNNYPYENEIRYSYRTLVKYANRVHSIAHIWLFHSRHIVNYNITILFLLHFFLSSSPPLPLHLIVFMLYQTRAAFPNGSETRINIGLAIFSMLCIVCERCVRTEKGKSYLSIW